MRVDGFVYDWSVVNGQDLFDDWLGNEGMCMNGWCALRYDSIESMDWISCVIDGSDGTVWFDQRILTYLQIGDTNEIN